MSINSPQRQRLLIIIAAVVLALYLPLFELTSVVGA